MLATLPPDHPVDATLHVGRGNERAAATLAHQLAQRIGHRLFRIRLGTEQIEPALNDRAQARVAPSSMSARANASC